MSPDALNIVILGLSLSSSWGNGHATTYRGLVRALHRRGHRVRFLERDVPWYAENRDLPHPPYGELTLYPDLAALRTRHAAAVAEADLVIIGSYVPQGVEVGEWVVGTAGGVTAFYDIDTPITLSKLEAGDEEYLSRGLIERYDLYLSFTGGPTLERLEQVYGARRARPLYCSFDPELYYPEPQPIRWDLGYMGTYSADRQPPLERLLLEPARRTPERSYVVAGPCYPADIAWPANVQRIEHLAPPEHRAFYASQWFTLNVTRADMIAAGYAPSVRLFEAAACGTPIISDTWPGLETFFTPGEEILLSRDSRDTLAYLHDYDEAARRKLAEAARRKVCGGHTAEHRALELEGYAREAAGRSERWKATPHG